MIGWLVFLIGALAVITALLLYYYRRDQRHLRMRTRDALSPIVRKEILDEIEDGKRRQRLFKQSLENAAKLAESQDNSLTSPK